jgi:hypothetical protein
MNTGRLFGLLALHASGSRGDREAEWRALHRKPDAPPLPPDPEKPTARARWARVRRLTWSIGRLARR